MLSSFCQGSETRLVCDRLAAHHRSTMLFNPTEICRYGLLLLGIRVHDQLKCQLPQKEALFRSHYGSSPTDLADVWSDLVNTNIAEAQLTEKEKSYKGLKMFLIANFELWVYPRSSNLISTRFNICETYSRGRHLWNWIGKIQALKSQKIEWLESFSDPDSEAFIITVDGTDCRIWEKQHETFPVDTKLCSKKFNHAAFKYEIALAIHHNKIVWVNGPFKAGGMHDITVFREGGLKDKMPNDKWMIADRGYTTSKPDEVTMIAFPNSADSKELALFKSRARARHESLNGRLKMFDCLNNTFRHSSEKHQIAFEAVCVLVQYQLDNGAYLFDV